MSSNHKSIAKNNGFKPFTAIFLLFLMITMASLVSASAEWNQYGNTNALSTQSQYSDYLGYFNYGFNVSSTNFYGSNITNDYPTSLIQPLVLYENTNPYIIIQNKTSLMALNSDLSLKGITTTGNATGSIVITPTSFTFTDYKIITGVYEFNASSYVIKGYRLDAGTGAIVELYSHNLPFINSSVKPSGLRYDFMTKKIVFVYDDYPLKFVQVTPTSLEITNISYFTMNTTSSPLIFNDIDGDNINDYMTFDEQKILIFNQNGGHLYNYTTRIYPLTKIKDVKLINRQSSSLIVDILIAEKGDVKTPSTAGNYTITARDISVSNTILFQKIINPPYDGAGAGEDYLPQNVKLSLMDDYNSDGYTDIGIFGTAVIDSTFATDRSYFYVISGLDGLTLRNAQYTFSYGTGNSQTIENVMTTAHLDNDSKKDFITSSKGRIIIVTSNLTNITTYTAYTPTSSGNIPINCISADIRGRNDLSVICLGNNKVYTLNSLINDSTLLSLQGGNFTGFNETSISGGVSGVNTFIIWIGNIFPDSEGLTSKQKITFVVFTMIGVFILIILMGFLNNKQIHPLVLWLSLIIEFMLFIFFITIGYISVGILILLVLILIAVGYFKFFSGNNGGG